MEVIRIYKDLRVTYKEFTNALLRLGYYTMPKENATLYINDEFDSIIRIAHLNTPNKMMIMGAFAAECYLMEMKGVIASRDDIAKMIEQDRLDALNQAQKTPLSASA